MKSILFSLACLLSFSVPAQQWAPDYPTAQATAEQEHKNIVLVFSGSDWCAPCIKLDREIWQNVEFQTAAAKDFVFYRADFPRRKENKLADELADTNVTLAERYNRGGSFPLVVVLTPTGEVIGQTGYQKVSPADYLTTLQSFAK